MERIRSVLAYAATAILLVAAMLTPLPGAIAVTGPSDSNDFTIMLRELPNFDPTSREYWREMFPGKVNGNGWSFGERGAYACNYNEHYTNNVLDFELHLELLLGEGYQTGDLEINDRFGLENEPDGQFCGDNIGPGASLDYDIVAHGDHHPHSDVEQTGDIVFYRDSDGDGFNGDNEFVRFDASSLAETGEGNVLHPGDPVPAEGPLCDEFYWTPGNGTAGPSIEMWWDEDGPTQSIDGVDIPCPGNGPGEPSAVALMTVQDLAPAVGYCVEDVMDGDVCVNVTFEPPPDTQAPVTTIFCNGFVCAGEYVDSVEVSLAAIDDLSGVAGTWYTLDGSPPTTLSTPYTGPFMLEADTTVRFFSMDMAGNIEEAQSVAIGIMTEATIGSGSTNVDCEDGSAPAVVSISPLVVSCL